MASAFLKELKLLSVFLVLVFGAAQVTFADRGRPHIDYSSGFPRLLTDKNTDLRGVSLSWDYGTGAAPVVPTQAQLNNLANNYGLNCVHVYLESYWVTVGANASIADSLVNMCGNAGLYVIITIGCADSNGSFNSTEATGFWNFYASRYKDRTHVIYEAYNEPAWYGPDNWTTSDWNNQVATYKNIRSQAPNTHILLFTFMGGLGSTSTALVNGVNYVKSQGVDFSNASIAFHGYTDATSLQNGINAAHYDSVPLALTCTEWATSDTSYVGILENSQVNWMYFTWLTANDSDLGIEASAVNADGIHWTPDNAINSANNATYYKLLARHSGKAMDAYGNGTANGTQIIQWTYGGGANQQWAITDTGNGYCKVIGVQSGKSLDIDYSSGGTADGTKVQLWDYWNGPSQQFKFIATDSGYYRISPNCAPNSCLDVSGVSANDGAAVNLWTWGGGNNQQWLLQPVDGTYKFYNRNSGKAMDAYNNGTANGTQIIQWTYGGGANQQWVLTDTGGGIYKVIGVQSGKSVDINNVASDNGTKVQLWDYWNGTSQQFKFTGTDFGYFRITPQCATGSCIEVGGNSTADGANVQLWSWANTASQQWLLIDPPPATPAGPTGLAATSATAQVALKWNATSGATSYNVKRSIISNGPYTTIATVTTTNYTNTGLANGTTYYYVVSAVSSGGETGNSSQVGATPIAAPTGLTAVAGTKQVALSWTASAGAQTYNVYRGTTAGQESSTPIASGISTASYTNTGLTTGTTYYYKVAAVNFSGTSSLSSEVSAKAK